MDPTQISPWVEWLAPACLVAGVALWVGVLARADVRPVERSESARVRREAAIERAPVLRWVLPFVTALGGWYADRPLAEARARLDRRLIHAGLPAGLSADEWMALRWVSAGALTIVAGALWLLAFGRLDPWFLLAGPIGYRLPDERLRDVIERRVEAIEKQLPHTLDLFIVCLEAGLSLEEAIAHSVPDDGPRDPLTEELALLVREMEFHDFETALSRLAERVPSIEFGRLVDTITESERQGTPYGAALCAVRDGLRRRQSARVEKAAARAVSAMLLPTVLIFASVLLVLGGGMALRTLADLPF